MNKKKNLSLQTKWMIQKALPPGVIFYTGRNPFIKEIHSLLERVLLKISRDFNCDRSVLMLFDPSSSSFLELKIFSNGQIMDGEEKIFLNSTSPFQQLSQQQVKWLKVKKNSIYFLIDFYDTTIGMVRLEKGTNLHLSTSSKKQISNFLKETGARVWNLLLQYEIKEQKDELHVLSAIQRAMSQSLNLNELLTETVKTVQGIFEMDRVKIYILDVSNKILCGQITCNFRGQVISANEEKLPLKPGVHPAVDVILNVKNPITSQLGMMVRVIPLCAKNEKLGVLMVDNLLSQEPISDATASLLEMVSSQIGLAIKNAHLFRQVQELSITDELTGLYRPRYFYQRIREELARSARQKSSLSVAILDLDNFKTINDAYGHPFGDKVLKLVAYKISTSIRKFDIAVRYGGDEFVILMPGMNETNCLHTIERIKKAAQQSPMRLSNGEYVTFSFSAGIASFPAHANTDEELLRKVDYALYRAKKFGRDRVVVYSED